ncbi:UPF0755 protein [Homoserinimonas aerilata]|uniref:Endolytic murein transglycosylase n=1 Tax=Homoserinimonas aerilata TaxID=1162970 RepID=A0A542YIV0_9MICO|nr:endolytic transglycosylase MltG [Homoserinimonas aerilata]TQL47961.1 UPF0755 protein [Homoserinimonas aerilata]
MANDDTSWDDIFRSQPTPEPTPAEGAQQPASDGRAAAPSSRREARAAAEQQRPDPYDDEPRRPRRRRGWIGWLVALLVVLGLAAGSVGYVWLNYEEQVRKVMGWEIPPEDYEGTGTTATTILIKPGDNGDAIAQTLVGADVVKSYDAFYELLLAENPSFYPGVYTVAEKMSARAALDALLDPANRVENSALIHEGRSIHQAFDILSAATEIPVEEFEAAAADPTVYGVAPEAPSLEGYLFPATYTFDPGVTAQSVLQTLVNRTFQALDDAGVAPADRHRVLTMAALIQREAGPIKEDFYKVSRVFTNRLEKPMNLESDATVSYGTGRTDTVWTTPDERADASNIYNTYANPGLPAGPIGAAGDLAIDAALHPVDGPWFYFVPINLETGETVFSATFAEHNSAVKQLQEWCRTSKSPNCD